MSNTWRLKVRIFTGFHWKGALALKFNVDILSRNGRILEVCHLPDDITIKALNGSLTTYKLFGVTYGNGNHFKSTTCLPSSRIPQAGWYEYDESWEHHQRGSGLRYFGVAKKTATPFGHFLSYNLYLCQQLPKIKKGEWAYIHKM